MKMTIVLISSTAPHRGRQIAVTAKRDQKIPSDALHLNDTAGRCVEKMSFGSVGEVELKSLEQHPHQVDLESVARTPTPTPPPPGEPVFSPLVGTKAEFTDGNAFVAAVCTRGEKGIRSAARQNRGVAICGHYRAGERVVWRE